MCADKSVTDLVTRARNGDKQAWDALAECYSPLVWSICHRHQLTGAEASDVGRTVWLQMADQLDHLPVPAAFPGWLATIAVRECRRALRAARRLPGAGQLPDADTFPEGQTGVAEHELLVAERHAELREAFARLSPRCQQLILLLTEDPPMTPAQISARLGIPVDSIGLARSRCLDKLRRHSAGTYHSRCAGAPSICRASAVNSPAHS
jgi:RNA polymerase sigma factor (sigma-70 family)